MGEAKRRGTFEQRKSESEARYRKEREEVLRKRIAESEAFEAARRAKETEAETVSRVLAVSRRPRARLGIGLVAAALLANSGGV